MDSGNTNTEEENKNILLELKGYVKYLHDKFSDVEILD